MGGGGVLCNQKIREYRTFGYCVMLLMVYLSRKAKSTSLALIEAVMARRGARGGGAILLQPDNELYNIGYWGIV